MTRREVVLAAMVLSAACTSESGGFDAGPTSMEDAGGGTTGADAGAPTDAGPSPAEDAGALADAGDAGTTLDAATGPMSTDSVACDVTGAGDQRLVYTQGRNNRMVDETLAYRFSWSCTGGERRLSANGVPNHAVTDGRFATPLSAQVVDETFDLTPEPTDQPSMVREPGYALNGVKFDPATAGTCPDDATSDMDCSYARGQDMWRMVATPGETSPWRFSFGVDVNDAHVQPSGAYHYHGIPVLLVEALNPEPSSSMTLVGWAADGFPIYSLYGHTDAGDSTSAVRKMQSSFQTIATPQPNRPSVEDFPLGHFESDWVYVEGSGDLDECNGRFAVTPEFPNGIYHYTITETYPFVQRCVKGR